jgi:UDP-GlcNAc:undecaprenyl-phosphate/decaprenyl-phosphate GlcNAc-1-phosphate transferase
LKTALLAFITALIVSYFLTPVARSLALRFNVMARPDARRIHDRPTPLWGGMAIYCGFMAAVILTVAVHIILRGVHHSQVRYDALLGVLTGGTLVALVGVIDDKLDLSPLIQFSAVIVGGVTLIACGIKISYINYPFGDGGLYLHWWAIPVTLIWIFGVTKTVDLMDGLDGLAAGICAIAAATLLIMTFRELDPLWKQAHPRLVESFVTVRILSSALLGASLAFLRYNYPPAKLFMGTVGAQFMGFVIASLSVLGPFKVAALVAIAVPVLVLGIPIVDTAFVVTMRAVRGQRVYEADKSHVHHRLLERGFTRLQTIWVLYLFTGLLSAIGLLMWFMKK